LPAPPPAHTTPLSLHDALPIYRRRRAGTAPRRPVRGPPKTPRPPAATPAAARLSRAGRPRVRPARAPPPPAPTRPREARPPPPRSEEHTSELQSLRHLVCRLLL